MKLTLIATGLFASSTITTRASPHNRRRGLSEWGIGHYGGTVGEIPRAWPDSDQNNNNTTDISNGSEVLNPSAVATPTVGNLAVLGDAADPPVEPTTTVTPTATAAVAVDQPPATITTIPTGTPTAVKREVHHLDSSRRERGKARLEEGEVDMLVALLNLSFEHENLRVGGECSPRHGKGCAGNSVVGCGSEGVWKLVADCDVPGLGLLCQAVREPDFWEGDWAFNVICLESHLVR